jgi:hypothetical protein
MSNLDLKTHSEGILGPSGEFLRLLPGGILTSAIPTSDHPDTATTLIANEGNTHSNEEQNIAGTADQVGVLEIQVVAD